jgi:hypothetical protein
MPVAPGMDQCMPDNFGRCPMTALHPASTAPEPTSMPGGAEVPAAHPAGVVLDCDTRSHAVSELREEVWLMPGA